MNEHITGEKFPVKSERNARLLECHQIINQLLNGEQVMYSGRVTAEGAKLYTLPQIKPFIIGAAVTKETAAWMGSWADGMITVVIFK